MVLRRLLRKRWVLGVVFGLSLIYFLTSTLKQVQKCILHQDERYLLPHEWTNVNLRNSTLFITYIEKYVMAKITSLEFLFLASSSAEL